MAKKKTKVVQSAKNKKIAQALVRRFAQVSSFGDLMKERELKNLWKDYGTWLIKQKRIHFGDPRYVGKIKGGNKYA